MVRMRHVNRWLGSTQQPIDHSVRAITAEGFQEEEELQLAMALSLSSAPAPVTVSVLPPPEPDAAGVEEDSARGSVVTGFVYDSLLPIAGARVDGRQGEAMGRQSVA